jgi:hypothetical protein
MMIWDTNYFQTSITRFRQKIKNIQTAPNNSHEADSRHPQTPTVESKPSNRDSEKPDAATADAGTDVKDIEIGHIELCQLELNAVVPYKVSTGFYILGFFVISLISIFVVRATLHNLPPLFEFFSNIYLAGTLICGRKPLMLTDS